MDNSRYSEPVERLRKSLFESIIEAHDTAEDAVDFAGQCKDTAIDAVRLIDEVRMELDSLRLLAKAAIKMHAVCPCDRDSTDTFLDAVNAFEASVDGWMELKRVESKS